MFVAEREVSSFPKAIPCEGDAENRLVVIDEGCWLVACPKAGGAENRLVVIDEGF